SSTCTARRSSVCASGWRRPRSSSSSPPEAGAPLVASWPRRRRSMSEAFAVELADFVLSQLPPAVRVLEVGCGREGGVAPALAAAGHDVLAIDPEAPEGHLYRRVTLEELDDPGPFDAVVAGRVLHHVHPLGPALEKLAALAPLLVLDEFAWNHLDEPTTAWYEREHRRLV